MCVGAALLGAGSTTAAAGGISAATAFNIGLGLTAANAFLGRAALAKNARDIRDQAIIANQNLEKQKREQKSAIAQREAEEKKSAAQNIFFEQIKFLEAKEKVVTSEQAGLSVNILKNYFEGQGGRYAERINQGLESTKLAYELQNKEVDAAFTRNRNSLQGQINTAYSQVPTLGQTLLNIGTQGVTTYLGLLPKTV